MQPVSPVIPEVSPDREVVYAKDQPEYNPLPTIRTEEGLVLSRWELSDEELERIKQTRSVYLLVMTFNAPLQPVSLSVDPPEFEASERA